MTLATQRQNYNVGQTLPQRWMVIIDVVMAMSNTTFKSRRQIYNVFSTSILQRCTNVVSVLRRTSNVDYSWSHGGISIALRRSCKNG